ncbi:MAG TPA: hypothetical protein VFL57_15430 [Bryobacteraceae bacterium]|nr:hypothetical protein [Bryobacteraceae bacterium]
MCLRAERLLWLLVLAETDWMSVVIAAGRMTAAAWHTALLVIGLGVVIAGHIVFEVLRSRTS